MPLPREASAQTLRKFGNEGSKEAKLPLYARSQVTGLCRDRRRNEIAKGRRGKKVRGWGIRRLGTRVRAHTHVQCGVGEEMI